MRHRPEALALAEIRGGGIGRAANKADCPRLATGRLRADRCRVGHHVGHLGPGAMPRIHRHIGNLRQIGAHRIGVVGGNASGPQPLQQHRLEIDQVKQRARDVEERLTGADQGAFGVVQLDAEAGAALGRRIFEKCDRQPRRADHRSAHKHRIGRLAIAEPADNRLGLQEIGVGPGRERGQFDRRHNRRLTTQRRGGACPGRHCPGARVSAPRRSQRRAPAPGSH